MVASQQESLALLLAQAVSYRTGTTFTAAHAVPITTKGLPSAFEGSQADTGHTAAVAVRKDDVPANATCFGVVFQRGNLVRRQASEQGLYWPIMSLAVLSLLIIQGDSGKRRASVREQLHKPGKGLISSHHPLLWISDSPLLEEDIHRALSEWESHFYINGDAHISHALIRLGSTVIISNTTFPLAAALLSQKPFYSPNKWFSEVNVYLHKSLLDACRAHVFVAQVGLRPRNRQVCTAISLMNQCIGTS